MTSDQCIKTIYTIEVLQVETTPRWYANKGGQRFEAELIMKEGNNKKKGMQIMFSIDALRNIKPNHCKIISEIKVK